MPSKLPQTVRILSFLLSQLQVVFIMYVNHNLFTHLYVGFFLVSVRQKVLEKENHELAWPGNGPFKLTLKLPPATDEAHDGRSSTTKVNKQTKKLGVIPKHLGYNLMRKNKVE